jgi:NAD(P)H-dependent flavin oxidoreductase YrpB (nitropropane dioxygenase family)
VDGVPHRVLRTPLVDNLGRKGLLYALRNAARFRKLSGVSWARMLRDGRAQRRSRQLSWAQVLMAANTPMLLKAAMVDGRPDLGVMACGQVVGLIDDLPSCAELIERIMAEARGVLNRLP